MLMKKIALLAFSLLVFAGGLSAELTTAEKTFVTKAAKGNLAEAELGKTIIMPLPTFNYVNMLLEAGAEARPLGRVRWLEATTGQPNPSPPFITCFILRSKRK